MDSPRVVCSSSSGKDESLYHNLCQSFLSALEILHWLSHNFNLLEASNKTEGIPTLSHPQGNMIFLGLK